MKKKLEYSLIGGLIGFLIGILPFFSAIFYDNIFEIIFALPIIPIGLIFGRDGHQILAIYLSPFVYTLVGLIIGYLISFKK